MKVCPKCGSTHEKPGTFCSRRCANSRVFSEESIKQKAKSSAKYWEGRLKTIPCKGCGVPILKKKYRVYCDNCKQSRLHEMQNKPDTVSTKLSPLQYTQQLIDSGEIHNFVESVIRKHMKRYLIHKNGHKCSICGVEKWCDKPVPLVCDHIDGDSTNSDLSNFRIVCCNCDAQLDTYKSKNRGRGRKYDRDLYNRSKEA